VLSYGETAKGADIPAAKDGLPQAKPEDIRM
jgi:hypothetical protein